MWAGKKRRLSLMYSVVGGWGVVLNEVQTNEGSCRFPGV